MWRGDPFSSTLLAALCGFLLIGLTESLFDGPRVTTLFFYCCSWVCCGRLQRSACLDQRAQTLEDPQLIFGWESIEK